MEILAVKPDVQGVRIHGIGGIVFFRESWMKNYVTDIIDLKTELKNKTKQSNSDEARQ